MKTTQKDFAYFEKECKKWLAYYGLKNWKIYIEHSHRNNGEDYEDLAHTHTHDAHEKIATICLNKDWQDDVVTREELSRVAKHEVLHVFFARFKLLAKLRFDLNEGDLAEEEHSIIRVLEKL